MCSDVANTKAAHIFIHTFTVKEVCTLENGKSRMLLLSIIDACFLASYLSTKTPASTEKPVATCTTEALEIKGTASRVCSLRLLTGAYEVFTPCVWLTQHSTPPPPPPTHTHSVVQTGYITPTRRFSDTLNRLLAVM